MTARTQHLQPLAAPGPALARRHRGRGATQVLARGRSGSSDLCRGAAGDDLDWFFAQWLHEPGYPVLKVEHGWDAAVGEIAVTIRQVQDPSWPTFRLPLELEIVDRDGDARRHQIELTERGHTFRFAASGPAGSVRVDPDGWVLKRVVGEEIG